ncbi:MAG: hypothetical protein ACKVP0_14030 [Pirellulaceae bacterium]
MKTHVFVLLPASISALELEDAFYNLLKPHHLDQSGDESQPDWKYDYLCLFDATLNCEQTEGELPEEVRDLYHGTISKAARLRPDATAGALVTPEGVWHDIWSFGWRASGNPEANKSAMEKWNEHCSKLLRENADCWVLETWAHS